MSKQPAAVYQLDPPAPPRRLDAAPLALTDIAVQHPGVYTVFRTYHRDQAIGLARHLTRLEKSAALMGAPLDIDKDRLRADLRCCIDRLGYPDTRLCISIPANHPNRFYLALEPFQPPPAECRHSGVRVHTVFRQRKNPRAKSTEWIALRRDILRTLPDDAYEGVLVGTGNTLLEGTSSNFYAVKDGKLYTAGQGVLEGTARAGLLEAAPSLLPVYMQPITLTDLPHIAEAMLTSSSRGVIPIGYINDRPIHDGQPGAITKALAARYTQWVERNVEPI